MKNSRLITNKLISTNVSIVFYTKNTLGKTSKFTRTLTNIKETASYEEIYNAALSISKLYEYTKFEIKLVSNTLIENDLIQHSKIIQENKSKENKNEYEMK